MDRAVECRSGSMLRDDAGCQEVVDRGGVLYVVVDGQGKSFQVDAQRVEVHIVPSGVRPSISILHVLSLMVAVHMEAYLVIEVIKNRNSIEVNRQLLVGNMVDPS